MCHVQFIIALFFYQKVAHLHKVMRLTKSRSFNLGPCSWHVSESTIHMAMASFTRGGPQSSRGHGTANDLGHNSFNFAVDFFCTYGIERTVDENPLPALPQSVKDTVP